MSDDRRHHDMPIQAMIMAGIGFLLLWLYTALTEPRRYK